MEVVGATSRLKELVEEIAVARNRLAALRAERETLVAWLRKERARREDPLHGVSVQVVFGPSDE